MANRLGQTETEPIAQALVVHTVDFSMCPVQKSLRISGTNVLIFFAADFAVYPDMD